MSWRTVAVVLIAVFAIVVVQSALAGPLVEFETSMNATGDYSNEHFDGNALIGGLSDTWFNMGLLAIFGFLLYGLARVVRRELTRGQF